MNCSIDMKTLNKFKLIFKNNTLDRYGQDEERGGKG